MNICHIWTGEIPIYETSEYVFINNWITMEEDPQDGRTHYGESWVSTSRNRIGQKSTDFAGF